MSQILVILVILLIFPKILCKIFATCSLVLSLCLCVSVFNFLLLMKSA